jgi:cobalamin biosynthesis protein CobD/CbiB
MIQENELAAMLIGIWVFLYTRKINLREFPEYRYFFAGFYCLLLSCVFTVLETFFLDSVFNFIEHLLYALGAVLLMFWCLRVFIRKGKA